MNKISILLADDHRLFRLGVLQILEKVDDIYVVGQAESVEETLSFCSRLKPDLVLMDISFPNASGVELTKQLSKTLEIKVLALTSHEEDRYVIDMLRAGASGYLIKNSSVDELVRAIRTIHAGHSYFSKNISKTIFENIDKEKAIQSGFGKLSVTTREMEVLKYLSEEMTNKEIASQLFISPRTVETHKRNLMQKLKVKNAVGLAKFYFKMTYSKEKLLL